MGIHKRDMEAASLATKCNMVAIVMTTTTRISFAQLCTLKWPYEGQPQPENALNRAGERKKKGMEKVQ